MIRNGQESASSDESQSDSDTSTSTYTSTSTSTSTSSSTSLIELMNFNPFVQPPPINGTPLTTCVVPSASYYGEPSASNEGLSPNYEGASSEIQKELAVSTSSTLSSTCSSLSDWQSSEVKEESQSLSDPGPLTSPGLPTSLGPPPSSPSTPPTPPSPSATGVPTPVAGACALTLRQSRLSQLQEVSSDEESSSDDQGRFMCAKCFKQFECYCYLQKHKARDHPK